MQNTASLNNISSTIISNQNSIHSSKIDKNSNKAQNASSGNLLGKDSAVSAFYKKWFQ
jgi:hypothetical protein